MKYISYINTKNNFIVYSNQGTNYTFEVNGKRKINLTLKYLKEVESLPVEPILLEKRICLFNYYKGIEVYDFETKSSRFIKIRAIRSVHFFNQDLCLFLKMTKAIMFDFKEFRIVAEMSIPDGWSSAYTSNGVLMANYKSITYRLDSDPFHPYNFKIKKEKRILSGAFSCDDKRVNILCFIGDFGEPEEFVEIVLDLENQTSEITVLPTPSSEYPARIWALKWFADRDETTKIKNCDLRYVRKEGKENISMFSYLLNKYNVFAAIQYTNFEAFKNECTDKAIVDEYIKMVDCLVPDLNCYADYKTCKENLMCRAKTLDRLISNYLK